MNTLQVLQKPIITEKTYKMMQKNVYVFAINPKADKEKVKKAFQLIFNVEVESVNILNYYRKPKRVGRYSGFKPGLKKAFITLKKGQNLDLLKEEAQKAGLEQEVKTKEKSSIFNKFKNVLTKKPKSVKIPENVKKAKEEKNKE